LRLTKQISQKEELSGYKAPWYYIYMWHEDYYANKRHGLIFFDLFIGMYQELKDAFRELFPNFNLRFFKDKDYWWGRIGGDRSRGCYAFFINLPKNGYIYLHWHVGKVEENPEWPLFRWRFCHICFPNKEWGLPFLKYYSA